MNYENILLFEAIDGTRVYVEDCFAVLDWAREYIRDCSPKILPFHIDKLWTGCVPDGVVTCWITDRGQQARLYLECIVGERPWPDVGRSPAYVSAVFGKNALGELYMYKYAVTKLSALIEKDGALGAYKRFAREKRLLS